MSRDRLAALRVRLLSVLLVPLLTAFHLQAQRQEQQQQQQPALELNTLTVPPVANVASTGIVSAFFEEVCACFDWKVGRAADRWLRLLPCSLV